MNPVIFRLGPFQVHWYGVLIVLGAVLAAWIATKEAKRRGEHPDHAWNLLIVVLILGIIGARLYHVFSTPTGDFVGWDYYRQHPLDIIKFWDGGFRGLGIYGGVIGGVIGVVLYTRFARNPVTGKPQRLSLPRWLDILAPGLLLAQAIGRLGNRINQELYGPETDLPWAFHINPNYPCQPPPGTPVSACGSADLLTDEARQWYATHGFHPTFYYEALWNLLGFVVMIVLGRKLAAKLRDGDVFFIYMIWYPFGRFWVEFLRPDAWRAGPLATAQWIAIAAIIGGIAGIVINHTIRRAPQAQLPEAEPAETELPEA